MEANFSKLTYEDHMFSNHFVCIHYNLCKISAPIVERNIFVPYVFYAKLNENTDLRVDMMSSMRSS